MLLLNKPILEPALKQVLQPALGAVDLLTCNALPYASASKTIGPEGGTLTVGQNTLVVPKGALDHDVTIKAEQMSGSNNSVRFSPEGLHFARPARLSMSYQNCFLTPLRKRIVYTDEVLKVLELLPSLDLTLSRNVSALIDHFSRYAVAF
jgi:hypothetical protein